MVRYNKYGQRVDVYGQPIEGDKDKSSVAYDNHWWTPSHLYTLKGTAVEPKVSDQRVVYAKGTNKGDCSNMTMEGLRGLAGSFPWPEGIELRLPCANGGALAKYPGCIVVYKDALEAGFRLPLHPFIRDFLSLEGHCPAELTPNSWSCILAFLLKFKELNLIPSYEAFKSLCWKTFLGSGIYGVGIRYGNLISNSSIPLSWGKKWFLVGQSEVFYFNFPMYPYDVRWFKGYTGKKDSKTINAVWKFCESLPGSPPSYKEVITAHRLVAAGLSLPLPNIGPSNSERYYSRRKREAECSSSDLKKMEDLSKKAKKSLSPFTSAVGKDNEGEEEEEEEDDLEEDEEEDEDPQEDVKEEEEEEREDLASVEPQERPIEPAPINSTRHMNGEKEVCEEGGASGRFSSFPTDSEWINSVSTFFRPEVSTALRQLPELISAAQRSEQLERELDESRKENVELRRRECQFVDELARKEREFQSRLECLELDKKSVEEELIETQAKLTQTAQKALELFDLASPSMKI